MKSKTTSSARSAFEPVIAAFHEQATKLDGPAYLELLEALISHLQGLEEGYHEEQKTDE